MEKVYQCQNYVEKRKGIDLFRESELSKIRPQN
jgi:hypothetical protein